MPSLPNFSTSSIHIRFLADSFSLIEYRQIFPFQTSNDSVSLCIFDNQLVCFLLALDIYDLALSTAPRNPTTATTIMHYNSHKQLREIRERERENLSFITWKSMILEVSSAR